MAQAQTFTEKLDALYEFDREPVSESKLHGPAKFMGLYAGEHVAGTEFIIGPLFVTHGVTATDMFLGLFIGAIVLSLGYKLYQFWIQDGLIPSTEEKTDN